MEFPPDLEQDSDDITPNVDLTLKKIPHDVKPTIKGKMLMMQEPMRESIDKYF